MATITLTTTDNPDVVSFNVLSPKLRLIVPPDSSGYSMTDPAETIRNILQGGASRYRQDLAKTSKTVQCTFVCSPAEYNYLRAFYRDRVRNGSEPFYADLVIDESRLTTHSCYFIPDTFYLASQVGLSYSVQAQLEARPLNYDATVDAQLIYLSSEYGVEDWEYYVSIIDEIINEDFPDYLI